MEHLARILHIRMHIRFINHVWRKEAT